MDPNLRLLFVVSNSWNFESLKPALESGFQRSRPFVKEIVCVDISTDHQLGPELDELVGIFSKARLVRKNSTIVDIFDLMREEPMFEKGFDMVYCDLRQFIDNNFISFMLKFTLIADEFYERSWGRGVPGRVFFILKLASSTVVDRRTLFECLPSFIDSNSESESACRVTFGLQEKLERAVREISERRGYRSGMRIKATGMDYTPTTDGEILIQFGFDYYAPEK